VPPVLDPPVPAPPVLDPPAPALDPPAPALEPPVPPLAPPFPPVPALPVPPSGFVAVTLPHPKPPAISPTPIRTTAQPTRRNVFNSQPPR
jgi:hypothetical protein